MTDSITIVREFLLYLIAILMATFVSRSYEVVLGIWEYGTQFFGIAYLANALVYDLQFGILCAVFVLVLSLLLNVFISQKIAHRVIAYSIAVVALIQILLIHYFGATQIPLGTELWAYSITEMTNTVIAAEQLTVVGFLLLIGMYVIIYLFSYRLFRLRIFDTWTPNSLGGMAGGVAILFIFSFIWTNFSEANPAERDKHTNKLSHLIEQSFASIEWNNNSAVNFDDNEYPLVHSANYEKDVLGPFFEEFEKPPNIVFLLVESLGGEFIGNSGQWTGFAPYLDSLANRGLYWQNGLSLSGRTFGMMPSLVGSLPFGKNGFMELGPDYPHHQTLISILNKQGYYTGFYSGYDTYFDGLNFFLNYQKTDFILNEQRLEKLLPESKYQSNYWGVDDKTMLNFSAELLDTAQTFPRLEIYHTLQSHSPFTVPNTDKYHKAFNEQLETLGLSDDKEKAFRQHRKEFTTLLYADQAVKNFMEQYRQKQQCQNTIFVITGDHWLIPVPQTSMISRYHVPIILYSPKLKRSVHFKSVNTHAEIVPSLLALLSQKTNLEMPEQVHWMSGLMDTTRTFQSTQSVPFMRNKNSISDYLSGEFYLFGDELYKLSKGMELTKHDNPKEKERLSEELNRFKSINRYVVENDKLHPGKQSQGQSEYDFLTKYDTLFTRLDSLQYSVDEQFEYARQQAFNENYKLSRAVSKRILLQNSDYHDVRILIGRTHTWQNNYDEAATHFEEIIRRDSTYFDAYAAYFDNEFWRGDTKQALQIVEKGLRYNPQNKQLLERKVKALANTGNMNQARNTFETLQSIDPDYKGLDQVKEYISE